MKKNNRVILCTTLFYLLVHLDALARNNAHLSPHVHGVSELTVAVEKQSIELEIKYPAIDILGFEHKAKTAKDIEITNDVKIILSQHEELFAFTNSECLLMDQQLDISSIHNMNNTEDEKHNNKEVKHHEVIASYHYHCKEVPTLLTITVNAFDHFSAIHQINTRWLTEEQQGSVLLSPKNRVIKLR
ncbi:ZrgA family zinc uptake protein [Colwellia sp. 20A7]|uniref:ZrgA family zinc uptake protein n=1 Tax=Colwellia sp. 20A7 TaxID=2689569 RepID=UPI0013591597|nr:DUF2796 domain-containing protein [Colwellia sp. 20A7]